MRLALFLRQPFVQTLDGDISLISLLEQHIGNKRVSPFTGPIAYIVSKRAILLVWLRFPFVFGSLRLPFEITIHIQFNTFR